VLAAGGITTGRAMAASLAAGAAGVRVGTRLLATPEAGAHPEYVAALLDASEGATVLTTAFAAGWPDAPHRVLRAALAAAEAFAGESVGTVTIAGQHHELPPLSAMTPSREVSGAIDAMAQYAGEGVAQITEVTPAAEVVTGMATQAAALLRESAGA
jgi:NAD(P)H-dependent flavin oxidoreductase YrpB (nitropropane dioxygenase family)